MRHGAPTLLVAFVVAACEPASGARPPRVTNVPNEAAMCPGSPPLHCLTAPNCQYDEEHQCQVCTCSPALETPQQVQTNGFGRP